MYAELTRTRAASRINGRGLRTAGLAALRAVWRSYEATAPALAAAYLGVGFDWPLWTAQGRCASAGRATGRARRVADDADVAAVKDGDVIVASAASPALLACVPHARAVVLTTGGELCAAARQAREAGVPAVCGLHDSVSEIKTGDWLMVDGDRGTIQLAVRW